jgi:uncharacterized protein (DUF1501 family)
MTLSRRDFLRNGASAFTLGLAAPAFLTDLALAQGHAGRNLVVLFLAGGNDALSLLVPYNDPAYYSRRPTIAVPAGEVLPIGTDTAGNVLGLHPRLPGLRALFDRGQLAIVQRTGYENSSRSHFTGTDIWGTANPLNPSTTGWLGRYLDMLPPPVDPLVAWDAQREVPRALFAERVSVPAIPNVNSYTYASPNSGAEAALERTIAQRMAARRPADRPHLSFVNGSITSAMSTLDRVATVAKYVPSLTYPVSGVAQALKSVAGAIAKEIGTKTFWVQTGGYDTHATQVGAAGAYPRLMTDLNDALAAFVTDLRNQGLLEQTLLVAFSEFGRRVSENGSLGCDHGAAGLMFALGGTVRGGLYGTAASLVQDPKNPTLENNAGDVRHETDFRSVYARVFDQWLQVDSVPLLGGDFRKAGLGFI